MAAPIFFEKNKIDLDLPNISITVTDATATNTGESFIDFIRNRNNFSGWMTTGSNDAANTQIDIDMTDEKEFSEIILVNHNWDSYTIQYFNGSIYTDFSTPINESGVTETVTRHSFTAVQASLLRIIITGTQVADEDKRLTQLLITQSIGQQTNDPEITRPRFDKGRRTNTAISGKAHIIRNVGGFGFSMRHRGQTNDTDLDLIESLFDKAQGFLVWLNAGDDSQFSTIRQGWRRQDFFLMKISSEYEPEFTDGFYAQGVKIDADFIEII